MFGLQRVGDLAWSAADQRCKGFLFGATAGRTTLAGEGLQHQDGQSHLLAYPIPNLRAYDPSFAFEIATIIKHGIQEMYVDQKDFFYYVTIENENYAQPVRPKSVTDQDILGGLYKYKASTHKKSSQVCLLGNGSILNEVLKAQTMLEETFNISADVYSVPSYKELHDNLTDVERYNILHPDNPKLSTLAKKLGNEKGVIVAASDYLKALPNSIAKAVPNRLISLGTDGFGRSEDRENLRRFFEVDANFIAFAAISGLVQDGKLSQADLTKAKKHLKINDQKPNPRDV